MKKATRIVLTIAGICIITGICIVIVISSMGHNVSDEIREYDHGWFENIINRVAVDEGYDNRYIYNKNYESETIDKTIEDEGIESIYIDVSFGELKVIPGDKYQIIVNNAVSGSFKDIKITGNTLKIEDGINITHFENFVFNNNKHPDITLTVPADKKFKKITLNSGTTRITVESITAEQLDIEGGVGECIINNSTMEEVYTECGVGNIEFKNCTVSDKSTFDCGVGSLSFIGNLYGRTDIACGVGNIDFKLNGRESDYEFDVSKGIGNMLIGNKNAKEGKFGKSDSKNKITIDGGVGNFSINFEEE